MGNSDRYHEREKPVRDAALGLDGLIQGYVPVQAEGTVTGYPFCFRARCGAWQFVVSLNPTIEAAALDEGGTAEGFFSKDGDRGYVLRGQYAHDEPNDPGGYMPYAEAEAAIRQSAARFVDDYRPDRGAR